MPFLTKETEILAEKTDCRAIGESLIWAWNVLSDEKVSAPKNDESISKGHRNHFEGTPTGKMRDNLSIKINRVVDNSLFKSMSPYKYKFKWKYRWGARKDLLYSNIDTAV